MDVQFYEKLVYVDHADDFEAYYSLLVDGNARASLTSIEGERETFVKHFVDSVACEGFFPAGARVADVGAGGGFPSLPLKIVRDDLSFTLLESSAKKCSFLRNAVSVLGLSSTEVLCSRAEDVGNDPARRESYDGACARAVAPLGVLCELCLPLVRVGGVFIAYKGPSASAEIDEAAYALEVLGGEIREVADYELPGGYGKRTAVVISKVSSTPPGYPRAPGRPAKRPLAR